MRDFGVSYSIQSRSCPARYVGQKGPSLLQAPNEETSFKKTCVTRKELVLLLSYRIFRDAFHMRNDVLRNTENARCIVRFAIAQL